MKPGVKTSEFAVTVLTGAAMLIASVAGYLSPHWAAISSSVAAGLYSLSRGWAKGSVPVVPTVPVTPPPPPAP